MEIECRNITSLEEVVEDQCFVFDARLVAGVWLKLETAIKPLLETVQQENERGRNLPHKINPLFDACDGLRVIRPLEIICAYKGDAHGGHCEYYVEQGGQQLSHLEALEVGNGPDAMIGAFYAAFELPKKGCFWHGCSGRDYVLLRGDRALAVAIERRQGKETDIRSLGEAGRPLGIRLLKHRDAYRLSCLASYSDGEIVDMSMSLDEGRITTMPEEVVLPATCRHFY